MIEIKAQDIEGYTPLHLACKAIANGDLKAQIMTIKNRFVNIRCKIVKNSYSKQFALKHLICYCFIFDDEFV